MTERATDVIVLTVMPDYGVGPFLWTKQLPEITAGVGGNCCDRISACGSHPMSDELHKAFAAWVIEFENAPILDYAAHRIFLDWDDFHKRGVALARRLKAEVGEAFLVIYRKPHEDPGRSDDERREVHADGHLETLPIRSRVN
jgi:hypothetical protein